MHSVQASSFLVVARWLAAFAVLIAHAGSLLISQPDIMSAPHGPGAYVWWFLTGFPHQAVIVFFVISGFLVGGNFIAKSRGTEPFLAKYFVDRTVRIYLLLVPVILLGWCLDSIGRHFLAGFGLYDSPMFAGSFDLLLLFVFSDRGTAAADGSSSAGTPVSGAVALVGAGCGHMGKVTFG